MFSKIPNLPALTFRLLIFLFVQTNKIGICLQQCQVVTRSKETFGQFCVIKLEHNLRADKILSKFINEN